MKWEMRTEQNISKLMGGHRIDCAAKTCTQSRRLSSIVSSPRSSSSFLLDSIRSSRAVLSPTSSGSRVVVACFCRHRQTSASNETRPEFLRAFLEKRAKNSVLLDAFPRVWSEKCLRDARRVPVLGSIRLRADRSRQDPWRASESMHMLLGFPVWPARPQ